MSFLDQYQASVAERVVDRPILDTDGVAVRVTLSGTSAASDVDVDAFKTNIGSTTGVQTFTGADFQGLIGQGVLASPRQITLTLSSHANWDATTATLIATTIDGTSVTESLSIPDGGNATLTTSGYYVASTSLSIPAQSGTNGTATLGYGSKIASGLYEAQLDKSGGACYGCWGATAVLPATGNVSKRGTFAIRDGGVYRAPGGTVLSAILTGGAGVNTGELSLVMLAP